MIGKARLCDALHRGLLGVAVEPRGDVGVVIGIKRKLRFERCSAARGVLVVGGKIGSRMRERMVLMMMGWSKPMSSAETGIRASGKVGSE